MAVEAVFLVLGVLPWWWLCLRPQKDRNYWLGYLAVCGVWAVYYGWVHHAWAGFANNAVELGIAGWGLHRFLHGGRRRFDHNGR